MNITQKTQEQVNIYCSAHVVDFFSIPFFGRLKCKCILQDVSFKSVLQFNYCLKALDWKQGEGHKGEPWQSQSSRIKIVHRSGARREKST